MKALLYETFGGPFDLRDVPDPQPSPRGVVVRVGATGVCRSDWHGWQGHDADIRTLPHVPGHELAGTVEAVGGAVTRFHPGDRVTVPFVWGIRSFTPSEKLVVLPSRGITRSVPSGCATVVVERVRFRLVEPVMVGRKSVFATTSASRA